MGSQIKGLQFIMRGGHGGWASPMAVETYSKTFYILMGTLINALVAGIKYPTQRMKLKGAKVCFGSWSRGKSLMAGKIQLLGLEAPGPLQDGPEAGS